MYIKNILDSVGFVAVTRHILCPFSNGPNVTVFVPMKTKTISQNVDNFCSLKMRLRSRQGPASDRIPTEKLCRRSETINISGWKWDVNWCGHLAAGVRTGWCRPRDGALYGKVWNAPTIRRNITVIRKERSVPKLPRRDIPSAGLPNIKTQQDKTRVSTDNIRQGLLLRRIH